MNRLKNHPIFAVFSREAESIKLNPAYRFLLFGGPLIGILLLFYIFHQGVAKDMPVAVVDQDNTPLSIQLSNAITASPDVEVLAEAHDLFEAQEWMKQGLVQGIVVLPNDLQKNVLQGVESPVPVYINGTNVTVAGVVQRSLLTTLGTFSAGIQLKKLGMAGNNHEQAMARVVPVNIQKHVLFNPYANYGYFLNSAMLYLILFLFAFMSSVYSFGNELKRGTGSDLLETSTNSIRLAIVGKILPYTVIFSGFAMLIAYLLYVVEGMPIKGSFMLLFFGQLITIVVYQVLGLMFVAATKNMRLSLSIGGAYLMMSVTFAGLTFPMEGMPVFAQMMTAIFPFTWWEKLLISQSLRGAPILESLPYLCYILVFMLVGMTSFATYKRVLADPNHWGKS
ncbi:ABC transporter permease [Mangrovibacterium sp.]|uniref:ABC transporter permease n=1 Tax=Mangrovibacterium sp. TaxID=1961364 RepID=UPI00356520AF